MTRVQRSDAGEGRYSGFSKSRLPEQGNFVDTGCDLEPACLSCSLPRCQYDAPAARLPYGFTQRTVELTPLIRAAMAEGKSQTAIAREFGVSRETVKKVTA